MTDDDFIAAFEAQAISRDDWTHEAHVRMGWIYVTQEAELDAAIHKARTGIQKLNGANGVEAHLYHETVTWAFINIIHAKVRANGSDIKKGWEHFRDSHPELFDKEQPILMQYYDKDTLESEEARTSFVDPNVPFST
jgi:hypothetical protein